MNSSNVAKFYTFADLMPTPKRQRPASKHTRAKPPSYDLTSDDHSDFLDSRPKQKSKKSAKNKPKETGLKLGLIENKPTQPKVGARERKTTRPVNQPAVKRSCREMSKSRGTHKHKKSRVLCANDDTCCLYCEELYSTSAEKWVQCSRCQKWAHYSCAGFDDSSADFTCELCDN